MRIIFSKNKSPDKDKYFKGSPYKFTAFQPYPDTMLK